MTPIEPLSLDAIDDPQLRALADQALALGVPDARFIGIIAHKPAYAKVLLNAMLMSHVQGGVDHRLKEIIRVQLAGIAHDPYFAALRSGKAKAEGLTEERIAAGVNRFERDQGFGAAEKAALRYAERMYLAPQSVDARFYDELKTHYSEAQIMELGAFIALHYGMQAFMRTLGAADDTELAIAGQRPNTY
jgi:alkylhydroperoxidase family enzyme